MKHLVVCNLIYVSIHSGAGQLASDWVLASMALLSHVRLEAVHAVNVVLVGSEASFCQGFAAGVAPETLGVPGLLLVADASRGDGLKGCRDNAKYGILENFGKLY